jgi:dTDP-4-dehydrorhamnose reductase
MAVGPVAVTGPTGRLGRALLGVFTAAGRTAVPWGRPEYDLDVPGAAEALLDRDRPSLVIHAAAWTDVDGCARDPALAERRNGEAVGELAAGCSSRGVSLVVVSTNEVFDGRRTDAAGYREDDPAGPINAYGWSKFAGEEAARKTFAEGNADLWVIRTSWLYGPPGADFPAKIFAAAARLPAGERLRVVADEFGSPTFTRDLADGIVDLVWGAPAGTYHLVNSGSTSRAGWAAHVLAASGMDVAIAPITQRDYERPSRPPAWGVLDASRAALLGIALRPWEVALDDYLSTVSTPR